MKKRKYKQLKKKTRICRIKKLHPNWSKKKVEKVYKWLYGK